MVALVGESGIAMDEAGYYEAIRIMKQQMEEQNRERMERWQSWNVWGMMDSWEAKWDSGNLKRWGGKKAREQPAPWDKSVEQLENDQVRPRPPWDPQVEDEPGAQAVTVAPPASAAKGEDKSGLNEDWRENWYDPRDRDRRVQVGGPGRERERRVSHGGNASGLDWTNEEEEFALVRKTRRWWMRVRAEMEKASQLLDGALKGPDRAAERWEVQVGEDGRRRKRITPSNYDAMEIHGFFGLIDDGLCGQGRMLICHIPQWVRGRMADVRDGDELRVWHVSGKMGGPLTVLSTGRHRYYSPGQKVTTWTICVPEGQWEKFRQVQAGVS